MTLNPVVLAIWLTILATFILSVWKGGVAERWAGSLVAAGALSAFIIHRTVPDGAIPLVLLFAEFLLACGFLALAVRFAFLWLGAAMLLQAVQFTLHAWYLLLERPRDPLFSMINNIDTMGILACILFGSLLAWRRRAAPDLSA
jgi:hypothetical protein